MKIVTDPSKIQEIISSRYIENILPSKEVLRNLLQAGKRLRIYTGIDPTSPHLHLGHSVPLLLLKKFRELGHKVIFLIGDFTAQVGDPTGKLSTRRALTHKEILQNCTGYKEQAAKILAFDTRESPVEIKFNSSWLSHLTLQEAINLMSKNTVGQMLKRDMFERRIKEGKEIYLHEFLYPLLQGYDSVAMNVDIEVGGNDQTFNMMVGRDLVREYLHKEKAVVATKLLINPKTQKKLMSKSEGNYIALSEKADQMYGKVMALPDEVTGAIFRLCTELPQTEIEAIERCQDPKEQKERLAFEIVKLYHGQAKAKEAKKEFKRVFLKKEAPKHAREVYLPRGTYQALDLLLKSGLALSKSEAKRLITQRGVKIDKNPIVSEKEPVELRGKILVSRGKKTFVIIRTT